MSVGSSGPRSGVFIDTGALVAVQVQRDSYHGIAREAWTRLLVLGTPLVTTTLVVGETYTVIRVRYGAAPALRFLDWLDGTQRLVRHHLSAEIEDDAFAILRQYRDQDFSYVDATSFAFMRRARVAQAFAFDRHFATAGFLRIPVDGAPG